MMDDRELERFLQGALAACQECIATNPVIVLGSGASVPFGLPTMDALGQSIQTSVETKIVGVLRDPKWVEFKATLQEVGLEPALQKGLLNDRSDIRKLIVHTAWVRVAGPDVLVRDLAIRDSATLPLTFLLRHVFQSHHRHAVVLTTNYDRLVEVCGGSRFLPLPDRLQPWLHRRMAS